MEIQEMASELYGEDSNFYLEQMSEGSEDEHVPNVVTTQTSGMTS